MITSKIKDEILQHLCDNLEFENYYSIDKSEFSTNFGQLNPNEITGILNQFFRIGLISDFAENRSDYNLSLLVEASDFLAHGGFYVQDEVLKSNIKKLDIELQLLSKELEPKFLEKANLISSIGSTIVGALGLLR
jgi:hypothetical protein